MMEKKPNSGGRVRAVLKGETVTKIHPVIMCGGAGTRMWPLSTSASPKQYLSLVDEMSLLASTLTRSAAASPALEITAPVLICGKDQDGLAGAQATAAGYPPVEIICEPCARNTSPVAITAALSVYSRDPEGLVLLLPADHYIADPQAFWASIEQGVRIAEQGEIVTFGIEPTEAATGYGYIESGEPIDDHAMRIKKFHEKPDAETAAGYLVAGSFYWNSGIFLYRADAMIREFVTLSPATLAACRDAFDKGQVKDGVRLLDQEAFAQAGNVPVDVEIMERTSRSAVVAPVRAGWNDIGSWAALAELRQELDGAMKTTLDGDVLAMDCAGGMVRSDGPFVATIGLNDVIVIANSTSVLVMHKDSAQRVKDVVRHLQKNGRQDLL